MKITIKNKCPIPKQIPIEIGQFYKYSDTDRIFIVASLYDSKYSLVELSDGLAWDSIQASVEMVTDDWSDFTLLENVDITISI